VFPCLVGGARNECGGARPRPTGRCGALGACLSPVRPVMLACIRAIGLELGCPLDDQVSATYCFGFVSSTYGSEPGKLGVTAVPPSLRARSQFGGALDHQASAWAGCLPFGVARPPEPPAALRAPLGYFADTPAARRAGGPVRCAGPGKRPSVPGKMANMILGSGRWS
jgi:hypothetical protein